jgi:hypothetical protein
MLKNSPYIDYFKDPPEEYLKKYRFDEISELNGINLSEIENGLDYYQKIVEITTKMQDRHQLFLPPFLQYYYFALPFSIVPNTNINDGEVKYKFSNFSNFTNAYISGGGRNLIDKV